jgi:predicted Rossmann-fold nucleotide-binding protein
MEFIEIDTVERWGRHIREAQELKAIVVQGLDLTRETEPLLKLPVSASKPPVFLGCQMEARALARLYDDGALVFPTLPGLPFHPYRGALYSVEELFEGFDSERPESYEGTLDVQVYRHWVAAGGPHPRSLLEALAQRLHDHAITDAMEDLLFPPGEPRKKVVAVMGGHSLSRRDTGYREVAKITRALARLGFLIATGGGPGAMEAAHLGAYFAGRSDGEMEDALAALVDAPSYKDAQWMALAFRVRARYPLNAEDRARFPSLGIPTWLYGHEPPNVFATHIAKYFANSVREDGILTIATAGVVFSPGSAGTIQEIFQDACQNHYKSTGVVSPMVFLGKAFWTEKKPVYPLLALLAKGMEYEKYLSITDSAEDVVAAIVAYDEATMRLPKEE